MSYVPRTEAEVEAYMAEYEAKMRPQSTISNQDIPDQGPEANLARKIVKYCDEHGFVCQCFRQSKKAKGFLMPGLPD